MTLIILSNIHIKKHIKIIFLNTKKYLYKPVWDYGGDCNSKYFSLRNILKYFFLFFKKLFLRSTYQNDL